MSTLPENPRISIITQVRMTSSRLPGKILRMANGKSMLQHHIERLKRSSCNIVVATTINEADNAVEIFANEHQLNCFRGDEHDVLGRFYQANAQFPADIIVRVTSDCPLIDAALIQQGIDLYIQLNNNNCYVSNCFPRTYARGFDFEIFSAAMLAKAHQHATSVHDREHVTPYMRTNHAAQMHNIAQARDNSAMRLTLDTTEDLQLLMHMLEETPALQLGYEAIEDQLSLHPEWMAINAHIEQKKV